MEQDSRCSEVASQDVLSQKRVFLLSFAHVCECNQIFLIILFISEAFILLKSLIQIVG